MEKYNELFNEYIKELDKAVSFEENRLDSIRENLRKKSMDENEIERYIIERFDPICCSGRVIAVFRKYWLKCDKLNEINEKNDNGLYVNPKDFTIDWLSKNGDPYQLYSIINDMPYYPIGIDEDGKYC